MPLQQVAKERFCSGLAKQPCKIKAAKEIDKWNKMTRVKRSPRKQCLVWQRWGNLGWIEIGHWGQIWIVCASALQGGVMLMKWAHPQTHKGHWMDGQCTWMQRTFQPNCYQRTPPKKGGFVDKTDHLILTNFRTMKSLVIIHSGLCGMCRQLDLCISVRWSKRGHASMPSHFVNLP